MVRVGSTVGRPVSNLVKRVPLYKPPRAIPRLYTQPFHKYSFHPKSRVSCSKVKFLPPAARSQTIRCCSYRHSMCIAKNDVATSSVDVSKGREVLPSNVKPLHYALTLEPDFDKFTYEGKVVIEYVNDQCQTTGTWKVLTAFQSGRQGRHELHIPE